MQKKREILTSPRKTNIALLAGLLLIPALGWNFLISPAIEQRNQASENLVAATTSLTLANAEAGNLRAAQENEIQIRDELSSLQQRIPAALDTSTLIDEVRATATPTTIDLIKFGTPSAPLDENLATIENLQQIPINLRLSGDSLALLAYPKRLTALTTLITVDSIIFIPPTRSSGSSAEQAIAYLDITARAWIRLSPETTGQSAAETPVSPPVTQ